MTRSHNGSHNVRKHYWTKMMSFVTCANCGTIRDETNANNQCAGKLPKVVVG